MSEAIRKAFEEYAKNEGFSLSLDAFFEGIYDSPATDKAFDVWIESYNFAKSESEQQIKEMREALEQIRTWDKERVQQKDGTWKEQDGICGIIAAKPLEKYTEVNK